MQATQIAPPPVEVPRDVPKVQAAEQRYLALDAYRGLIMILLVSSGFGFRALAKDAALSGLAAQFDHVPWVGAVFWDIIQPAFMFMVGLAMPFALARRREQGATFSQLFRHVGARALRLLLLSQILMSIARGEAHFQLINVLSQIAFTYFLCFLILQLRFRWQAVAAAGILAFHAALFYLFPGPEGPFSKTGNVGAVIDLALLGRNYPGLYVTINFISSIVTTLFGCWAGMLLRQRRSHRFNLAALAGWSAACFAAGLLLSPWIPLVKRIWTGSWTLYSTGWVLLILMGIYALVELAGFRRLVFPLLVVGTNSIFVYSINEVLRGWLDRAVAAFTFRFAFVGTLAPVTQACTVLLVMWYMCYWLYRRKIFFKL